MVTCPKCGSEECKKDGIVKGRQRHKCKSCKTSAGYRLLLIDMGKGSSTAYWAIAGQQPESNCGVPSRIPGSEK